KEAGRARRGGWGGLRGLRAWRTLFRRRGTVPGLSSDRGPLASQQVTERPLEERVERERPPAGCAVRTRQQTAVLPQLSPGTVRRRAARREGNRLRRAFIEDAIKEHHGAIGGGEGL